MKTFLIALALLAGAAVVPANAQQPAATDNGSQPAAASKAQDQTPKSDQPIDITYLVPKDSALKDADDAQQSRYRVDKRGVDCTRYPARCR
ncbi:MAG: hypothetical protein FWG56_10685 [Desulfovibrionaceae bacterium]|nr:hypothetical protein [Desulfovibrionaceae bacterium]